ncbi:MAG TPA: DUF5663 domain-containing protein [Candidatus Saccharimonadales bacterium]
MNQSYITEKHLEAFGIAVNEADKASLLEHLNDTLKERIGTEIAAVLDDTKLQQLVSLQESGTEEQIGEWLAANVPELQQIIEDEIDILMGELADSSDTINQTAA